MTLVMDKNADVPVVPESGKAWQVYNSPCHLDQKGTAAGALHPGRLGLVVLARIRPCATAPLSNTFSKQTAVIKLLVVMDGRRS